MNYYKKYTPYLFLLPAVAVLIVFFFIPFFQTFGLSFFDYSSSLYHPTFSGLDNYSKLFKEPIFYKVMFNTFMYLLIAVPFLVTFPLFLAILINQKIRGITLYKILLYLPVIVSIVVAAIAFKWLYAGQGILNYALSFIHLPSVNWLVDTKWALFSVAVVTIWKGIGYYMMIYLASLMSVPQELYESASVDGANKFQKLVSITIPLLKPTIESILVLGFIYTFKVYDLVYVMTEGGPVNSTHLLSTYSYKLSFDMFQYSKGSAVANVLFLMSYLLPIS